MTQELMRPRPYQREALDAIQTAWENGMQRPAVVLSTGLGKTVIFSHLINEDVTRYKRRVVVLAHREELVDQARDKLRSVAPKLHVGKVKAGHNDVHAQVVVASVQTLARKRRMDQLLAAGGAGLVIADECHHFASRTYRKVLEDLGCFTPGGARLAGFTATLARGDGIGLGSVFEDVVYTRGVAFGIKNGFLVPPVGISVAVDGLDLSGLKRSGGDYAVGALGRELEDSHAMAAAAAAYVRHGEDRPAVMFTPTVATAHEAAKELEALEVTSAVVSGETPTEERARIFRDFREGRVRVLVNCMVLTEGFDAPWASCAVMARPTQSKPLFIQMVGRVLRPFPGKTDALVLDLVGAATDNRLQTLVDLEEGLFKEAKPCEDCRRTPCACPCYTCGKAKQDCTCPKEERAPLQLTGTGGTIDMFAASQSLWLQTPKGVWFIPCGDQGDVVLWPGGKEETFTVAHAPQKGAWTKLYEDMPFGEAMAWAESEAEEMGGTLARRGSRWRKDRPSEAQVNYAQRLGIDVPDGIRKGDLGDLITVHMTGRRVDRFVPHVPTQKTA